MPKKGKVLAVSGGHEKDKIQNFQPGRKIFIFIKVIVKQKHDTNKTSYRFFFFEVLFWKKPCYRNVKTYPQIFYSVLKKKVFEPKKNISLRRTPILKGKPQFPFWTTVWIVLSVSCKYFFFFFNLYLSSWRIKIMSQFKRLNL